MPKISFVMPVKNGEMFIEKTINSLLSQTIKDSEIVVVNDHSEDKTENILKTLCQKEKRLKILDLTGKAGVAAARNAGTEVATGEIILPVDADDPNYPDRAETSIAELEKNNCQIFYGNIERYFVDTQLRIPRHFQSYDEKMLRNINIVPHGASAFLKSVYNKVGGYDETLQIGEDYDFFLTAQEKGMRFCSKDICLAQYTMHQGQLTSENQKDRIAKRQKWNRIVRQKHSIYQVDPGYVAQKANPEVQDFYIKKNFDIWFGPDSIPSHS